MSEPPGDAGSARAAAVDGARAAAALCARRSYGRLVALLASSSGDIADAEDVLSAAFEQALRRWPDDGVPSNPDAWLLTVARNGLRDRWKSVAHRTSVALDADRHAGVHLDAVDIGDVPDRRLALMLACAHPNIDPAVRTLLMLDAVMGFTAREIGRAFAVPASTMAARLGRAKRRIKESHTSFRVPGREELPAGLGAVLAAVYGAYAMDWLGAGTQVRDNMSEEALHLAETVAELVPNDGEAHGLAALIALSSARAPARVDANGRLVPLAEQDPARWNRSLIDRGEAHLRRAHARRTLGRYQLEAAVAALHCARRHGPVDHRAILDLYDVLRRRSPTMGTEVARAAAIAEVHGPRAALSALDAVRGTERFQPARATRAHMLALTGDAAAAVTAFDKAISLTTDIATRRHLERQQEAARVSAESRTL